MMKSVIYSSYGNPDVLQIEEQAMPQPAAGEILIKVQASTVAATDSIFRQGQVFSARLFTGFKKPSRPTLGSEFSGEVVALGEGVTRFQLGDLVFGPTAEGFGAHSEYLLVKKDAVLVQKPQNLTLIEAAALSAGALTALPFLQDVAQLQAGQKIMILGASGSVGSFAVQIARYLGAHVTAVCSSANLEWVRALGAEQVLDYTQDAIFESGSYDIIFDSVGKSEFREAQRALKAGGQYLTTVLSGKILWQNLWTSKFGAYRARFAATGLRNPQQKQQDLNTLLQLVKDEALKVVIDRIYPLEDIQHAHRYVDQGHKKGNVVVTLAPELKALSENQQGQRFGQAEASADDKITGVHP